LHFAVAQLAGVVSGGGQSESLPHAAVVPSAPASETVPLSPSPPLLPPPHDPALSETASTKQLDGGRSQRAFQVRAR
jgi:hypothetical protein